MLSKERLITYSIIFILLSALVYFVFLGDEKYVEDYNIKIDALEAKVDSLHHINDDLVFKIDTLNQQIVKLDTEIDKQDKKIVTLKYKVNEKVNSVDSFNDDELTRFFTERYRHYEDSIKKADSASSN
jgi:predicted RNase H-like nuclease (RuvC/YqgF family)